MQVCRCRNGPIASGVDRRRKSDAVGRRRQHTLGRHPSKRAIDLSDSIGLSDKFTDYGPAALLRLMIISLKNNHLIFLAGLLLTMAPQIFVENFYSHLFD
jgi:hypothetical protein